MRGQPKIIYMLLGATFLEKFSKFLIVPFLSIYLITTFNYTGLQVGVILSSYALTGMFMAFVAAPYMDRLDKRILVLIGLSITVLAFATLPFITYFWGFILFTIAESIGAAFSGTMYRVLITIFATEDKKALVFNVRYYLINLSAAISPLIATQVFTMGIVFVCSVVVVMHIVVLIGFMTLFIRTHIEMPQHRVEDRTSFKGALNILKNDRVFTYLIVGNILFLLGYSQMTYIIPQYYTRVIGQLEAMKLYAMLLFANGCVVIVGQYAIYRLGQRTSARQSMVYGGLLTAIGLIGFAAVHHIVWLMVAMIIFTFGEMLVFTMWDIRIDEISRAEVKGAYYSLAELRSMGNLIAPLLGGFLIDTLNNGFIIFSILALAPLLASRCFVMSSRIAVSQRA